MRILIVEDHKKMATYLKQALEEQGFVVDIAGTGGEALDWVAVVSFDLIILDVMLPALDGITFCQILRQRGVTIPIIMLTARDSLDDRIIGLDAGADDYLVKPFELRELLARMRALARRPPLSTGSNHILQIADLTLNRQTRSVIRANKLIELTNKEYAVLETLMRQPEYILTRTEIAEAVWNYDVYNQSNVVDVYIRNLRRKIDDPFELKLIHTVRGAGYRLSTQSRSE